MSNGLVLLQKYASVVRALVDDLSLIYFFAAATNPPNIWRTTAKHAAEAYSPADTRRQGYRGCVCKGHVLHEHTALNKPAVPNWANTFWLRRKQSESSDMPSHGNEVKFVFLGETHSCLRLKREQLFWHRIKSAILGHHKKKQKQKKKNRSGKKYCVCFVRYQNWFPSRRELSPQSCTHHCFFLSLHIQQAFCPWA